MGPPTNSVASTRAVLLVRDSTASDDVVRRDTRWRTPLKSVGRPRSAAPPGLFGHSFRDLGRGYVLPVPEDGPAGLRQLLCRVPVACDVARDLGLPVGGVRPERTASMFRAAMPKAAVNEYSDMGTREDNVGPSGNISDGANIYAVTKSSGMKKPTYCQFRGSVAMTVRLHIPTTCWG